MKDIAKDTDGRPPIPLETREGFLAALAQHHHVTRACEASGMPRAVAYRLRNSDPVFMSAWEAAMEALPSRVMDAAIEEGLEGAPVFDAEGKVVARQRDTRMLQAMFRKFHDPQRGSSSVNVAVGVQNNLPSPDKDYDEARADWLRRRKAMTQHEAIDAEVVPVSDDVSDLI